MVYLQNKLDPNYERNKFFNHMLLTWSKIQQINIIHTHPNASLEEVEKLLIEKYNRQKEELIKEIWELWKEQNV